MNHCDELELMGEVGCGEVKCAGFFGMGGGGLRVTVVEFDE